MSRKPKSTKSQPYSKLTAATPPSTASPVPQMTAQQAYQVAEQRFKAGQLREAEIICRQVLEVDSRHANTLHLLGVMAAQANFFNEAERLITEAIAINSVKNYHDSLANIYRLRNKPYVKHQINSKKQTVIYTEWYNTIHSFLPEPFIPQLIVDTPIDIIIPVYNGYDYLTTLIPSVLKNTRLPHRIILLKNLSQK